MEPLNDSDVLIILGKKELEITQLKKYAAKLEAKVKELTPAPVKDAEMP